MWRAMPLMASCLQGFFYTLPSCVSALSSRSTACQVHDSIANTITYTQS